MKQLRIVVMVFDDTQPQSDPLEERRFTLALHEDAGPNDVAGAALATMAEIEDAFVGERLDFTPLEDSNERLHA